MDTVLHLYVSLVLVLVTPSWFKLGVPDSNTPPASISVHSRRQIMHLTHISVLLVAE